jgi:hypothetical protein
VDPRPAEAHEGSERAPAGERRSARYGGRTGVGLRLCPPLTPQAEGQTRPLRKSSAMESRACAERMGPVLRPPATGNGGRMARADGSSPPPGYERAPAAYRFHNGRYPPTCR